MKKNVLILGNGKSRLAHVDMINSFDGFVSGCGSIFLELISGPLKRLDGLTGDNQDLFKDALKVKKEHGFKYDIYEFFFFEQPLPESIYYPIPENYLCNSGINWLVYWLTEGKADKIYICGMDFGGYDLHNPGMEHRDKSHWVTMFRKILKDFPEAKWKCVFIGKDHMPYLLSSEDEHKYARLYTNGEDHLLPDYLNWTQEELLKRYPLPIMDDRPVVIKRDPKVPLITMVGRKLYKRDGTVEIIKPVDNGQPMEQQT